jgi:hypothetical protein
MFLIKKRTNNLIRPLIVLKKTAALLIIILCISSCIEDITVDLPQYQPKLAVFCVLQPDSLPVLFLNESTSKFDYGDTSTSPSTRMKYINNALVVISNDFNERDTLRLKEVIDPFRNEKKYYYEGRLKIEEGRKYYLFVSHEGRQASAETTVPLRPVPGNMELNKFEDSRDFTITMYVKDIAGEDNYYHIIADSYTDTFGTPNVYVYTDEFNYQSDKGFDGKDVPLIISGSYSDFNNQDTATVYGTVARATKATGLYLYTVGMQSNMDDNPFSEPVIIQHNITGGLGLFGAKSAPVPFEFKIR